MSNLENNDRPSPTEAPQLPQSSTAAPAATVETISTTHDKVLTDESPQKAVEAMSTHHDGREREEEGGGGGGVGDGEEDPLWRAPTPSLLVASQQISLAWTQFEDRVRSCTPQRSTRTA